jgi:hypothetical protein
VTVATPTHHTLAGKEVAGNLYGRKEGTLTPFLDWPCPVMPSERRADRKGRAPNTAGTAVRGKKNHELFGDIEIRAQHCRVGA